MKRKYRKEKGTLTLKNREKVSGVFITDPANISATFLKELEDLGEVEDKTPTPPVYDEVMDDSEFVETPIETPIEPPLLPEESVEPPTVLEPREPEVNVEELESVVKPPTTTEVETESMSEPSTEGKEETPTPDMIAMNEEPVTPIKRKRRAPLKRSNQA